MPSSPFGLAYGLGAGLAGVPGAIQQGKEQALAMSMRNLQNQQMQQNWNEEQATNAALSAFQPKQDQTIAGTPANPGQQLPQTTSEGEPIEYSASSSTPSQEMQNMGAVAPTKATPEKVIPAYSSPYAKQADRLNQAADMLDRLGMGRASFKLRQEASQYGQQHLDYLGSSAAKQLLSGNSDKALPLIHELGYTDATGVSKDDDGNVVIEREGAEPMVLDKQAMAVLASGGKTGDFLQKQAQWEMTLQGQQARANAITKSAEIRSQAMEKKTEMELEGRLKQISLQGDNAKEVARIRTTAAGKGVKDTAYWINVNKTADQLTAEAQRRGEQLDPVDAVRLAREQIPVPGGAHMAMSQNQQVIALQKQQKSLQDTYGRKVFKPDTDPTSPYSRHQALQAKIDSIMGGSGQAPTGSTLPAPRQSNPILPPPETRPDGFKGTLRDGTPVHWSKAANAWVRD